MTNYREILRLRSQGISLRCISLSCECAKSTVMRVLKRAQECSLSWPLPDSMTDQEVTQLLFPHAPVAVYHRTPDYEYMHKEMARSGVTLTLLWNEYCESCRNSVELPLMYTQFCKHYRDYVTSTKATMHIDRKPGELMEVDWAGRTLSVTDADSGDIRPAYLFVSVLPCSGYTYAEAFLSMDLESWIAAHVHTYHYWGGVTRILVPDNLKTGVDRVNWYTPVINRTYHDLAEHYGTAVIPARVRHPKDKANVEGTVGILTTHIVAALRNQKFFSLYELNTTIQEKLETFNARPFQKKPGSRLSVFLEEEKEFLIPLPIHSYELSSWKIATVQNDYHVSIEDNLYSVPYEYIKRKVDVRITRNVVEIFFAGNRIASHPRLHGGYGQYSTVSEHMPESHRKYSQWNGPAFRAWAEKVGPNTQVVVESILSAQKVEEQGYRSCTALLKLADTYSLERLELACARAITYTPHPNLKSVQTILKTGQDRLKDDVQPIKTENSGKYGFTRGAQYYGRD